MAVSSRGACRRVSASAIPPRSIHPHTRRPRMGKLAMFAAVFALGLAPVRTAAQGREVTGRVIRAVGEVPVAGATIIEVGGQGVTQSGADGSFRIAVAAGELRLLVRAIGYERKVVVGNPGESNMVVKLAEDPFKLEAVVVTGQTTTLERRNATTANVSIRSNELTNAPAQKVEQAKQGKAFGRASSMNRRAPGSG